LGSAQSSECQIDSIAQSWAVLSGAGDTTLSRRAMQAVIEHLVQTEGRLVRLFKPPFDKTPNDPGYIKAYPPGIRENGGQYTHAAIWTVWALTMMGEGEQAMGLFEFLNPVTHGQNAERIAEYRVDPFVVAADVYSEPPYVGRGGWTWYTGSSGWLYRLGVEAILGLRRMGDRLAIDPCIPPAWRSYGLTYRFGSTLYRIRVENPMGASIGVESVEVDGKIQPEQVIPMEDDGREHQVTVRLAPGGQRIASKIEHILRPYL
jgi:cyclic beta-1,2-glucan synthetase